jgi:hypothetical protein
MADELAGEIDEIAKAADELSISIILGTLDEKKLPMVDWDIGSPSTWKSYLAMAKNLGCSFVVLERYGFDQTALEELGPEPPDGENSEEFADEEQADRQNEFDAKWKEIVLEHASYYGSLLGFALYYFGGGVCHKYNKHAAWYTKLTEAAAALKGELEAAEAELEEEEDLELTEKEIENFASELAQNELFQKATNQNARRFVLKKKLPEIAEQHYRQISQIIDQAKGIFELEIKPEMEKALDNQIADLAKQGLDKDQIAKRVKVPLSRVKKVL